MDAYISLFDNNDTLAKTQYMG